MSSSNYWKSKARIKEYRGENAWFERGLADGSIDEHDVLVGFVTLGVAVLCGGGAWFIGSLIGYWASWGLGLAGAIGGLILGAMFADAIIVVLAICVIVLVIVVVVGVGWSVLWEGYERHLAEIDRTTPVERPASTTTSISLAAGHPIDVREVQADSPVVLTGTFRWEEIEGLLTPALLLDDEIEVASTFYHMGETEAVYTTVSKLVLVADTARMDTIASRGAGARFQMRGQVIGAMNQKWMGRAFYPETMFRVESSDPL